MPQTLIPLAGAADAPVMNIALANGFVPQTYLPIARHFAETHRVISLPPRALWGDGAPPDVSEGGDWRILAYDLLAAFQTFDLHDVIAVGHSFGGVASMMAALQQPDRFKALILLDPTLLPHHVLKLMDDARAKGESGAHQLAEVARNRLSVFVSVDAAFEWFRSKSLFAGWSDELVRFYAEYGTVERDDGKRSLTWSPLWEAYYFSTVATDMWDDVPRLNALDIPILIVAGSESDTFLPTSATEVRDLVPKATHRTIDGHGHLFPQTAPDATAQLIQDWLATLDD